MMKKFGGRNHIPYTEYRIRKVSCHIGFIFLLEPFLMDACRKLIFGQQFLLQQSIASVVRHGIFPNSFVDFYLLLVVCIVLLTLAEFIESSYDSHDEASKYSQGPQSAAAPLQLFYWRENVLVVSPRMYLPQSFSHYCQNNFIHFSNKNERRKTFCHFETTLQTDFLGFLNQSCLLTLIADKVMNH